MTETYSRTITARLYSSTPKRTARVVVTIDLDAIAQEIGKKAIFNTTHKSRAMKGAVTVKAYDITEEGAQ